MSCRGTGRLIQLVTTYELFFTSNNTMLDEIYFKAPLKRYVQLPIPLISEFCYKTRHPLPRMTCGHILLTCTCTLYHIMIATYPVWQPHSTTLVHMAVFAYAFCISDMYQLTCDGTIQMLMHYGTSANIRILSLVVSCICIAPSVCDRCVY